METIQLGVDEIVLKKFGEEKIKEYLAKMIAVKKMEFLTGKMSSSMDMSEEEYEKELENIREAGWKEYKKDLPV